MAQERVVLLATAHGEVREVAQMVSTLEGELVRGCVPGSGCGRGENSEPGAKNGHDQMVTGGGRGTV
jgi:hypothetical protein